MSGVDVDLSVLCANGDPRRPAWHGGVLELLMQGAPGPASQFVGVPFLFKELSSGFLEKYLKCSVLHSPYRPQQQSPYVNKYGQNCPRLFANEPGKNPLQ